MTILYLYAELMGYQIPVLEEYVTKYKASVHVVHWDHKKITPYQIAMTEGKGQINYYKRSEYDKDSLTVFALKLKPDIVYVSGWMDKEYIKTCNVLKKNGAIIIAGSDTQWRGTLKQRIGIYYFKAILKKCYSYVWVAGPYQYEYARKLGFKKTEILFNSLSADTHLFKSDLAEKKKKYPHNFLFVGRFEKEKGIDLLLDAWRQIKDKKDWTLTFIGSGSLKKNLTDRESIIVKDFLQPEKLISEIEKSGCFILPSIAEPWGLVIHECAIAGLPIIVSDICGAAPVFVTPNFNGFMFKSGDSLDLVEKMNKIIKMSDDELIQFSENSLKKGTIISPEITAATFMSVL